MYPPFVASSSIGEVPGKLAAMSLGIWAVDSVAVEGLRFSTQP
jgi:hypothetical protein